MQENGQRCRFRGLRMLSIVLPLCLLGLLYVFATTALAGWPRHAAAAFVIALVAVGVVSISSGMLGILSRQDSGLRRQYTELEQRYAAERRLRRQMKALQQASLKIGAALDIDGTLQHLVDLAREVLGARYAALGIVGAAGEVDAFYTSGIGPEGCAHGDLALACGGTGEHQIGNIRAGYEKDEADGA